MSDSADLTGSSGAGVILRNCAQPEPCHRPPPFRDSRWVRVGPREQSVLGRPEPWLGRVVAVGYGLSEVTAVNPQQQGDP